jgi:hypothetical protein
MEAPRLIADENVDKFGRLLRLFGFDTALLSGDDRDLRRQALRMCHSNQLPRVPYLRAPLMARHWLAGHGLPASEVCPRLTAPLIIVKLPKG